MKAIKTSLFLVSIAWLGSCQADTPLPEWDQVFQIEARVNQAEEIQLDWQIKPDYFLFRNKIRIHSQTLGIELDSPVFPASESVKDDFFGKHPIYRKNFSLTIPLKRNAKSNNKIQFSVQFQGCLSFEQCYSQTAKSFTLDLSPLTANNTQPSAAVEPVVTTTAPVPSDTKDKPNNSYFSSEDDYLEAELAFQFSAKLDENTSTIKASWKIADGYYLYKKRLKFNISNAENILGKINFPTAELKADPNFGDVYVYHHQLDISLPLNLVDNQVADLQLEVGYQGCAEAGLCYAPETKQLSFPVTTITPKKVQNNEDAVLQALAGLGQDDSFNDLAKDVDFLKVDDAFVLSTKQHGDKLTVTWQIAPDYYLYRKRMKFKLNQGGKITEVKLPEGETKTDDYYGEMQVFRDEVSVELSLENPVADNLVLDIGYQGCADAGLCYAPQNRQVDFSSTTAQSTTASSIQTANNSSNSANQLALSEEGEIAQLLSNNNIFMVLLMFFGLGLLLSLTPCVFPMIPILSSIIVGQADNMTTRKAFTISLTYVLAMAVTYTFAGIMAGLLGENIQAALQNPWVLSSFVMVFVLLALSMFGFYELQLPSGLQSKLTRVSNNQQGGSLVGVAIMGFLSALIVGPCIAPPLAGALLYISQTKDAVLGGMALFSMSMGMGIPLILVGMSAGRLLPKAGGWMDTVKYVFGVLLLATGIWMLERIVSAQITMLLYAILLIISAVYMGALESLKEMATGWKKLWKGLGLVMLIYGVILMVGLASGGNSLLQPLPKPVISSAGGGAGQSEAEFFHIIKGIPGLETALADAKAKQQWLMLDFYADWCVSCKEMEHFTFSDAKVRATLADMSRLQADVTKNDDLDKALMKKFQIMGPPALLFFNPEGQEQRAYRIVGFKSADDFLAHIKTMR